MYKLQYFMYNNHRKAKGTCLTLLLLMDALVSMIIFHESWCKNDKKMFSLVCSVRSVPTMDDVK